MEFTILNKVSVCTLKAGEISGKSEIQLLFIRQHFEN